MNVLPICPWRENNGFQTLDREKFGIWDIEKVLFLLVFVVEGICVMKKGEKLVEMRLIYVQLLIFRHQFIHNLHKTTLMEDLRQPFLKIKMKKIFQMKREGKKLEVVKMGKIRKWLFPVKFIQKVVKITLFQNS